MVGYDLFVISGIDGNFDEFEKIQGKIAGNITLHKLPYEREISFRNNLNKMHSSILTMSQKDILLLGWSIGAVAAAFLANYIVTKKVVMINPFFSRKESLRRRNIYCEEEVSISDTHKAETKYIIVRGEQDDKIPPTESTKIMKHYNLGNDCLFSFKEAKHNLSSFPVDQIVDIIFRK